MHPTAALLALRGCVPLITDNRRRIATQHIAFASALYAPIRHPGAWSLSSLSYDVSVYEPAFWDIITDVEWDQLPPEILAEFLERL